MTTNQDMEIAKKIISRNMISKAEMQRHLDDLTRLHKAGKQVSLPDLLIKRGIVKENELRLVIQADKKRIVHCGNCGAMYRVKEHDINRRFKCKQCHAMVIVPSPGQTQKRKIKELIDVQEDEGEKDTIDTRKVLRAVERAKTFNENGFIADASAEKEEYEDEDNEGNEELTVLLDLDVDEDE